MRTFIENDRIVACLAGRVDSTNAEDVKAALDGIVAANPGRELVIDAGERSGISSAGLRVLLRQAKRQDAPLTVRNVSPEVYEIFDMTGFTGILRVTKRLRELSVDGCEIVGRGAIGTVYRIDEDTIVKVYELPDSLPMIENEQKRAKQAFLKGIPTAISYDVVKVGEKYGSVFEMLKAFTLNDALIASPEKREKIVEEYASLIRQVHEVEMDRGELPEAKGVFLGYLDGLKDLLGEALFGRLRALFEAMPEDLHVVHGDIQMKNVMLSGDEPMLIDMDTLSVGDPVFDLMSLCVTYQLYIEDEPDNSMRFLGITGEMSTFVYERTLARYFSDRDTAEIREAEKKIRIVACVRFLFLVAMLGISLPELKQLRVEHTLEHLRELVPQVDSLTVARHGRLPEAAS